MSEPLFPPATSIGLPRSGLRVLRDGVAAYFISYQVPATVTPVGLKYRTFQQTQDAIGNGSRVTFIPGEFDGVNTPKLRNYGSLSRECRNHSSVVNARELLNWDKLFTISIWAAPNDALNDTEWDITEMVEYFLEKIVQAAQTVGMADIQWGDIDIVSPPVDNAFGEEILVHCIQHGPIFDVTRQVVHPTIGAVAVEMFP